ncbi:fungal specific actin related protein [Teratosphaeria destructans]|uniref:Fungal specific actin related protein n=1 Tax=Teratosphaeria destructans TaxID=418781 RepID=A0A9W7STZ5_9PEZI|nr:fungal specific actin related protein [Teratosphaeria destructans]
MAASPSPAPEYFASRPAIRTRPSASGVAQRQVTPGPPRTPLLGRSISSQFGSPGSFRTEQEDNIVYELGARHLSAGFAGESRPRCMVGFTPNIGRRAGDYRQHDIDYRTKDRKDARWGEGYELYRTDIRELDLDLVEDKLERILRRIHSDYLQLDQKPRKAVLVLPSLLPAPLLEIVLRVLFNHYSQPPNIMLMTAPILATVASGLRSSLLIDVGWEETVVTAVGEYHEIAQRRSVRAGKMLTQEMANVLQEAVQSAERSRESAIDFAQVEDVTQRLGWCRPRINDEHRPGIKTIPLQDGRPLDIAFHSLSEPAEAALFAASTYSDQIDDHDLPIHLLAYNVLLSLPQDLRALCASRIIFTGGVSNLPGLKPRVLHELNQIINVSSRGWDPVASYGSATAWHERALRERDANIASQPKPPDPMQVPVSALKMPIQDNVPHHLRVRDDIRDEITAKAERHTLRRQKEELKRGVRGVDTLGAWAGASLVASLRVKGVHEVEREDFLKHGLRNLESAVF